MSAEMSRRAEVLALHGPVLRQTETGAIVLAGCMCGASLPNDPDWTSFAQHLAAAQHLPDPYDKVVFAQGHRHSEPVCAWPDCRTYLTREQMAELPDA
jgi:hypothetical protein